MMMSIPYLINQVEQIFGAYHESLKEMIQTEMLFMQHRIKADIKLDLGYELTDSEKRQLSYYKKIWEETQSKVENQFKEVKKIIAAFKNSNLNKLDTLSLEELKNILNDISKLDLQKVNLALSAQEIQDGWKIFEKLEEIQIDFNEKLEEVQTNVEYVKESVESLDSRVFGDYGGIEDRINQLENKF